MLHSLLHMLFNHISYIKCLYDESIAFGSLYILGEVFRDGLLKSNVCSRWTFSLYVMLNSFNEK